MAGEIYGTVDNNMDGQVLRIVKCMESVLNGNTKKYKKVWLQSLNSDYSLVIAPVVAELCTTSVALSAPPNSYQNNSQS